jgi:chromosome partitioning protein
MIILVGGEKGGTGKTTVVTNLAALAIRNNKDLLLVDTDKQGSASSWASVRDENEGMKRIPCVQKFGENIAREVKSLNEKYADILIDAGGQNSQELRAAMLVADKLYIPIQAAQFDVWTLGVMDKLVSQAKLINENLEAFILINRAATNPSINEIDEVKEVLEEFEYLKLSPNIIRERIAFRKAARGGLSVVELSKQDPKATLEVTEVFKEVYNEQ